jgi:hypothetical protein
MFGACMGIDYSGARIPVARNRGLRGMQGDLRYGSCSYQITRRVKEALDKKGSCRLVP